MIKLFVALGMIMVLTGWSWGNRLTEAECRELENFWEFDWTGYVLTQSGESEVALNKFTWNNDYCEYVQEIQFSSDYDSSVDDSDGDVGETSTDTDTDEGDEGGDEDSGGEDD